jgi:hypothetical protein
VVQDVRDRGGTAAFRGKQFRHTPLQRDLERKLFGTQSQVFNFQKT